MPLLPTTTRRAHHARPVATTRARKPSLLSRIMNRPAAASTTRRSPRASRKPVLATPSRATAAPVHHHKRRPSIGDKVSGALMRLRGSLTRRSGKKAAGTRRMRGTDGKGARRTRL